jgi:hypothetical protein
VRHRLSFYNNTALGDRQEGDEHPHRDGHKKHNWPKEDPKTGAKTPNLPGLRDHNEYGKGVILPATIREDAGNRDLHHDQLSDLFRNESGEIY